MRDPSFLVQHFSSGWSPELVPILVCLDPCAKMPVRRRVALQVAIEGSLGTSAEGNLITSQGGLRSVWGLKKLSWKATSVVAFHIFPRFPSRLLKCYPVCISLRLPLSKTTVTARFRALLRKSQQFLWFEGKLLLQQFTIFLLAFNFNPWTERF